MVGIVEGFFDEFVSICREVDMAGYIVGFYMRSNVYCIFLDIVSKFFDIYYIGY